MLNDEPTLPNLPRVAPGASPPWPVPDGRSDHRQPHQPMPPLAAGCLGAAALATCVVLLFGVVTLLSHASLFTLGPTAAPTTSRTPTASPAPGQSLPGTALSPSPVTGGWLQVVPVSVQLGCGEGQQSQVVTLTNRGPQSVPWQASLSLPPDQAAVEVSPASGELDAGASTTIQLTLHNQDTGQQGILEFFPGSPAAGSPASLSYTTAGCG